jgi:thioredoxin reductase
MAQPAGSYPVVVVGSGPGGLQVSAELTALGVRHATISADPAPGGMFRRWPHFQRLLSWTKPYVSDDPADPLAERADWNSLLTEIPGARAIQREFLDGTSSFPSRAEMEANLAAFAERAAVEVRYDCAWRATRLVEEPDGTRFVLETDGGEYRAAHVVLAVGVAEPWSPPTPGIELAQSYAEVQDAEAYRGQRVLIIGKQNSGFELANGMLPWARSLVLVSPSPTSLSVVTRTLVGVRARYLQPFEDAVLGGGVTILDASLDRIERTADGSLAVHLRRAGRGDPLVAQVDAVVAATGFQTPLLDLPSLGVAVTGQSRLPVQTDWWESATLPGIHFAGTITQGARGLRRHGVPSNSGAVHGARYNARLLARRLAALVDGHSPEQALVEPDTATELIARELTTSPELFHQRGYLARVLSVDGSGGLRDEGTQPLAHVLDASGPAAIAVTLEADGSGSIYPVLFTRVGGVTAEHVIEADPTLRYDGPEARKAITSVLRELPLAGA